LISAEVLCRLAWLAVIEARAPVYPETGAETGLPPSEPKSRPRACARRSGASCAPRKRLKSKVMADTLYLSLWYPNLLLESLADKLQQVLGAFAVHGGEARVYSATVWPMDWSETPAFQRIYGNGDRGVEPKQAVEDALELLHDDYAYEFQIGWSLWELETGDNLPSVGTNAGLENGATGRWVRQPRLVRVTGYGPLFDEGAYEQDGHIRIDFGSDSPFLEEDVELEVVGARHVEENVRQLVELTAAVEKASGATARLLWSELGESLAQRLAARLGMTN